jgi:hypothetical protein
MRRTALIGNKFSAGTLHVDNGRWIRSVVDFVPTTPAGSDTAGITTCDRPFCLFNGLDFEGDVDLLADEQPTRLKRHIPHQTKVSPVNAAAGAEPCPQVSQRILALA